MDYTTIKQQRKSGEAVSLKALNQAIAAQKQSVATMADKVARLTATLHANTTDPTAGVLFVSAGEAFQREMRRLAKLYGWLDKALADQPLADVEIPDHLPDETELPPYDDNPKQTDAEGGDEFPS